MNEEKDGGIDDGLVGEWMRAWMNGWVALFTRFINILSLCILEDGQNGKENGEGRETETDRLTDRVYALREREKNKDSKTRT